MKFKKVTPKEQWSADKTQERIELVMAEMSEISREINLMDKRVRHIMHEKRILQIKLSNKNKYFNQLQQQLKNTGWIEL